ncbi:MAG: hypothetical protein KH899_06390 [Haemophilus pittmaniae]|uniref:hypothetical protein n=1 Tax=Haemophilus pittmaniae TaxID=249188 RepID=UPI0023F3C2B4|nr:hypothetical protein [Haemophilus pittmaniae]MBS6027200.1 hypothetical protein [Haemophilus pittmaniae]
MELEQTTIKTTAHFLATARYMAVLNLVLLMASLIKEHCIFFNLLLAVALLYLHIRLDFDQRIFANSQNFNEFDRTLVTLGLLKQTKARSVTERTKGAIHLWYKAFFATMAQLGLWLI